MAAEADKVWDVAIVGSGFAGALIAHELGKGRKNVIILEAGAGVPTNFNEYMRRFYSAAAKVPESPYTPEIFGPNGLSDPSTVNAGRPTVLSLGPKGAFGDWTDPKQAYLIQKGPRPFASTYDRVAGGTSHWLGTCLRFVPNDFKMKSRYGQLLDWPIEYKDLDSCYGEAEKELGVSADVGEQTYCGIEFPSGHTYPMPKIPNSTTDQYVNKSLNQNPLTEAETGFLGMGKPVPMIPVRGVPAARNSAPYRNRRACAGNTNCIPICPIQAKYDPTITLNDARNTGFVTFKERTVAYEIVLYQSQDLRHRGERNRDSATTANVKKRRPDRQGRGQQKRHGGTKPDGPSLLCRLGHVAGTDLSLSWPADHLGHRRSVRWGVSSRTRRVPSRHR